MWIEMMWLKSVLKSVVVIELLLHVQLESLPINIIVGPKSYPIHEPTHNGTKRYLKKLNQYINKK